LIAVTFLVLGLLYLIARVGSLLYPILRKTNQGWDTRAVHQIAGIFLKRLIGKPEEKPDLDQRADRIRAMANSIDMGLLEISSPIEPYVWDLVDDEPAPTDARSQVLSADQKRSLFVDVGISSAMSILCIVLLGVGWKRLISPGSPSPQTEPMANICFILTVAVLVAAMLRSIVAGCYLIPKFRLFSLKLRRLFFKMVVVLSGVTLLPILGMILRSTDTKNVHCQFREFMDFRSNTPDFLAYFTKRNASCVTCTKASMRRDALCDDICSFNASMPLEYAVLKDAPQVNNDDLSDVYLIPINLLEVYFLAIFLQGQRAIFTRIFDLLECLPAPTELLEIKFASILIQLKSSAGFIFNSYKYEQALFYFTFTQIKLFVLFFASLFPIFPVEAIKDASLTLVSWMFFGVSLLIALLQIFIRPYVSILHNVVTGIGYGIGAISALFSALAVLGKTFPDVLGDTFLILIVVAPITSAFIVPLFARKHWHFKPIPYTLRDVMRRRDKIVAEVRPDDSDIDDLQVPKVVQDTDDDEEKHEEEEDYREVLRLAEYYPIIVQKGMKKRWETIKPAAALWKETGVIASRIRKATKEMLALADRVLDCVSFNSLVTLLNVSIIFVSCCCGYGLGAGTATWKKGTSGTAEALKIYPRCNMDDAGNYPAYGTY
jgi:hypothetical protein